MHSYSCQSYVSLGYCSLPAGKQTCCATCSSTKPTPAPPTGGIDVGSILDGLGGLIPGLGGGGASGGGQQPQQPGGNPIGALGSLLGGLTGGGGSQSGGGPLSALGNALGGGGSGGTSPLSAITNGLGTIGNLANLAGMLGWAIFSKVLWMCASDNKTFMLKYLQTIVIWCQK